MLSRMCNFVKKLGLEGLWIVFAVICSVTILALFMTSERTYAQGLGPDVRPQHLVNENFLTLIGLGKALDVEAIPAGAQFHDDLKKFYDKNSGRPLWLEGWGRRQPRVHAMLHAFEQSWTHGLNPENYAIKEIRTILEAPDIQSLGSLEILLSQSAIRYARDLTGMRIEPGMAKINFLHWRTPMTPQDVLRIFSEAGDIEAALASIEPQGKLYTALREELKALAFGNNLENKKIRIDGNLRPGMRHRSVALIRYRLGISVQLGSDALIYDDNLSKVISELQKENGLKPDGSIGPKTLAVLNRSAEDRMFQIIANMERLRWIEPATPSRYVLVNIPSATLWGVDNGEVKLEMPVIVGKKARPTLSFRTDITGVRFNPTWTVPPTIKKADFLPMLQEDSNYLATRGMELVKGDGRHQVTIDPTTIDWDKITSQDLHSMQMVMGPGPTNPLGRVRVIMDNPYDIYLHDTDHPDFFALDDRNLSSGCIRVSQPRELAEFILESNPGWSGEKMAKLIDKGKTVDIPASHVMPVYILYQTVWQDESGRIIYGPDIYGQDERLVAALKEKNEFYIPLENSETIVSEVKYDIEEQIETP